MGKVKKIAKSVTYSLKNISIHLHPNILLALGIMPLAAVLTFLFLGEKSLWLDETFSVAIARSELPTLWEIIYHGQANMSLYYILLHLWINLGDSEFIIRTLSVIFALLTVPAVFVLSSRLFNKQIGLLTALLLIVNSFFIIYSQDARSYSLVLFLASLSSLFFVKVIHRPSKWSLVGYVITSVLAVYAHVFACFVLAAHAISLLFMYRQQTHWKVLLVSWIAIVLLILPLAYSILSYSTNNLDWQVRPNAMNILYIFVYLAGNRLLLLIFFVICLITLFHAVRQWSIFKTSTETWHYALLLLWLFLPVIMAFCISQIIPMFAKPYFIICIPPLFLLAAIGISHMPRWWISAASIVIILALSGFRLYSWYAISENQDFRGATNYILSMAEQGDAIVMYPPSCSKGFDYYESRVSNQAQLLIEVPYFDPEKYQSIDPVLNIPDGNLLGLKLPEPDKDLIDRLEKYRRVWLFILDTGNINPELRRKEHIQMIQDLLQEKYGIPDEDSFYAIKVFLFSSKE